MRKAWIVPALAVFLLLFATGACGGQKRLEPAAPATGTVSLATETAMPVTPTVEPTIEEPTAAPTAVPQPTPTPQPTSTPRPTHTPVPTARPLAAGECIAWHETPSFLGQDVCVEGKVNFVRSANPARSRFFLVVDPSVPDIDHCCGLFYGWLYVESLYDPIPTGGLSGLLEGRCVRLHGTVEKAHGRYRISVKTPEQLEIIECSECQIRDACES
jgi:hypothetical protein